MHSSAQLPTPIWYVIINNNQKSDNSSTMLLFVYVATSLLSLLNCSPFLILWHLSFTALQYNTEIHEAS